LCCASSADWFSGLNDLSRFYFLFNNYSISQDKGVGIIQEALCEIENKGFCIKSNELSIPYQKTALILMLNSISKGRYPQHSNSIVFSFSVKLGSF
jgi:hypothetical protein